MTIAIVIIACLALFAIAFFRIRLGFKQRPENPKGHYK